MLSIWGEQMARHWGRTSLLLAALAFSGADPVCAVEINVVAVGNPGNPPDPATGYGSVAYAYSIGTYEVTNGEYVEFLNAVDPAGQNPNFIYQSSMASNSFGGIILLIANPDGAHYVTKANFADKPVVFVHWSDALRFANWLENGQPTGGGTEDGAYDLSQEVPTRKPGARWVLAAENEWYKAAYYDPVAAPSGYWLYATRSDTPPASLLCDASGVGSNPGFGVANVNRGCDWNGSTSGQLSAVGSAGNTSYYGTSDQAGNVREAMDDRTGNEFNPKHPRRDGYWGTTATECSSLLRLDLADLGSGSTDGFRVSFVPEPGAASSAAISLAALLWSRWRIPRPRVHRGPGGATRSPRHPSRATDADTSGCHGVVW
jgi:formylglycine-generating enzyme required for sulfatase activity